MILEDHGAIGAGAVDGFAVESGGAGVGADHSGGDVEEGGFAAAGRADDDDEFAGGDVEGDVVESGDVGFAEAFVDVAEGEAAGGVVGGGGGGHCGG